MRRATSLDKNHVELAKIDFLSFHQTGIGRRLNYQTHYILLYTCT